MQGLGEMNRAVLSDSDSVRRSYTLLSELAVLESSHGKVGSDFRCLLVTLPSRCSHWKQLCEGFGFDHVRIINGLAYKQALKRTRLSDSVWADNGIKVVSLDFIKNRKQYGECLKHHWDAVVMDDLNQFNTSQRIEIGYALWRSKNIDRVVALGPTDSKRPDWMISTREDGPFESGSIELMPLMEKIAAEIREREDETALVDVGLSNKILETALIDILKSTDYHPRLYRLPSAQELAHIFDVTPNMARESLQLLREAGLISWAQPSDYLNIDLSKFSQVLNLETMDREELTELVWESGYAQNNVSSIQTEFEINTTIYTAWTRNLYQGLYRALVDPLGQKDSIFAITGSYGSGKTHSLDLLRSLFSEQTIRTDSFQPGFSVNVPVTLAFLNEARQTREEVCFRDQEGHGYTLWGQLAYQISGELGCRVLYKNSNAEVPPARHLIHWLLGRQPTIILIDDIDEQFNNNANRQFLLRLLDEVQNVPHVVLAFTSSLTSSESNSLTDFMHHEGLVIFDL